MICSDALGSTGVSSSLTLRLVPEPANIPLLQGWIPIVEYRIPAAVSSTCEQLGRSQPAPDGLTLTVFLGEFERVTTALKVRASHYELLAADLVCSLKDAIQVIGMDLLAVIDSAKYRIGKVDANLDMWRPVSQ